MSQILNVEIKAKCNNPNDIRALLKAKNARFIGEDHQVDTYFNTDNGRLKLREGSIENSLIHYCRDNQAGPKQSQIHLERLSKENNIKAILTASNGIKVIVDKKREIYFIGNVKFHLDTVKELGSFVEIEAISENSEFTLEQLQAQCDQYMEYLKINSADLIEVSYSDLILSL